MKSIAAMSRFAMKIPRRLSSSEGNLRTRSAPWRSPIERVQNAREVEEGVAEATIVEVDDSHLAVTDQDIVPMEIPVDEPLAERVFSQGGIRRSEKGAPEDNFLPVAINPLHLDRQVQIIRLGNGA